MANGILNSCSQVGVNPNNVAVYVCKGKDQVFNYTFVNCCGSGEVTIEFNVDDTNAVSPGTYDVGTNSYNILNFGTFYFRVSGIYFRPATTITAPSNVQLTFDVVGCAPFTVEFIYDPCCCKCHR